VGAPRPPAGTTYHFADLMEHGRKTGAYEVAPEAMGDYVRQRIALVRAGSQPPVQLRLTDGRILKVECIAVPDGGRMLTYADISDLVHTAEQLRELATIDDLTKLLNRRQFLASFEDEFSRALRHDRPLSVVMIDADNFKLINDATAIPPATRRCAPSPSAAVASSGNAISSVGWAARSSPLRSRKPICPVPFGRPCGCARRWRPNRLKSATRSSR
jgi:hypothetical protein